MTSSSPPPPGTGRRHWSTRRRIVAAAVLALVAVLVLLVVLTMLMTGRVLRARDALEAARGDLTALQDGVGRSGGPSTAEITASLDRHTAAAAAATSGTLWRMSEIVPIAGPNLRALRQVSTLTHGLVADGVDPIVAAMGPAGIEGLKPVQGRIPLDRVRRLAPAAVSLDRAVASADAQARGIDTAGLLPQVARPVASLRADLGKLRPLTTGLREFLPALYPVLGGDGPRHYLLMFQNNAEERASGGNPAALSMLDVTDGRVTLGRQPNSRDFPHPYPEPVVTFGGDWERIYGAHVTTYETNTTFTPDFPKTAVMTRTMWLKQFGGPVDGVVSLDPVALSELLKATGPIRLANGKTLTSRDAVPYLLSGVYAQYRHPSKQDAVFASAARAVFTRVTGGHVDVLAMLKALKPMLDQQRLKAWSVRPDEERLLMSTPAGTMLPADNAKATVLGVYNNDDSTSKMSYYMQDTVDVAARLCPAQTPRWTVTTKVTDTLKASEVPKLTPYVLAGQGHIVPGGDRQWVQVYGPVGATLVSARIDGTPVVWGTDQSSRLNTVKDATGMEVARPAVQGVLDGRPVGSVSVTTKPGQTVTVTAVFSGGTAPSRTIVVSHTPRVWPVPVSVERASCR